MRLEEKQVDSINALYGDDTKRCEKVTKALKALKGKVKVFNEDGSLSVSKEELEAKVLKKPKTNHQKAKVSEKTKPKVTEAVTETILSKLSEVETEICKMTDLKDYQRVSQKMKTIMRTALDSVFQEEKKKLC